MLALERETGCARFGYDPTGDEYLEAAGEHGYCLAFKVESVERLNLSKPEDFKFPDSTVFYVRPVFATFPRSFCR